MQLLETLGYQDDGSSFRHPKRQAVFCGDFVDRGPRIADTICVVRNMVKQKAAHAVMGNHEFNAIAFHTEVAGKPESWYRPHTKRNVQQHRATTDQLSEEELSDAVKWFRELPIALDLEVIRVVHACWDPEGITALNRELDSGERFDSAFLAAAVDGSTIPGRAVERVLKGPEIHLPDDRTVSDKEGHVRRHVRIRWFESPQHHSLGSYAFPHVKRLCDVAVPESVHPCPYPKNAPPVFIGHYWLDHRHNPVLTPNVACLDLSVAKGGRLAAYRFDGETELKADSIVSVPTQNHVQAT